jgi:SH3 domain-containing YSC84-like protein 1
MKKLFGYLLIVGIASVPVVARAATGPAKNATTAITAAGAAATDTADTRKLETRLENSRRVLEEIEGSKLNVIPRGIASMAKCVAIVPGLVKGAIAVGAEYGQGVATCRTEHGWSGPVFIRMAGGSFGFQIGGQGTDLVLVATNRRGMDHLLSTNFKIGGRASAAAGPVGRDATASTDISMRAELLSWSRSHGIFAGVDLNGVMVSQNALDTSTLYGGRFHNFDTILEGQVPPPPETHAFLETVTHYFGGAEENNGKEQDERNDQKEH